MRLLLTAICVFSLNGTSIAGNFELANQLGNLLASEDFCELIYDPGAIAKFIEDKVPADDLEFAGTLQLMTAGNKVQLSDLSNSGKVAHCLQTKRVAASYGFIKN